MDSELIYQVVRFAFTLALLLFLVVITRTMLKELSVLESSGASTKSRKKTPTLTLLVIEPGETSLERGNELVCRKRQTVGRSEKANLRLADPSVSSQHAVLETGAGRWHVQDLRSTNGTVVNGNEVIGITALENGDILEFGRVQVRVMC